MGLTIGGQIHLARKARGYSLQALADEVGVSKTAVIKWEEGSNSPSVENLIKLEKILDVRFYLSGGTSHANGRPKRAFFLPSAKGKFFLKLELAFFLLLS